MTDPDYDEVASEALRLVEEVAMPALAGKENALGVLNRLAGLSDQVTLMLIVRGLEAAKDQLDETVQVCSYFMALGAILSTDHQRRQRIISIERAKHALPDFTLSAVPSDPPVGAQGEATVDQSDASKDGQ